MLYKNYYSFGLGVCLRYCDNKNDASEIVNDGFLKVFAKISSYSQDKSFKGWLRKIMVNTAIDHFRKSKTSFFGLETITPEFEMTEYGFIEQISADEILEMIQKLPHGYRIVFNLFAIEGYNHSEISKMLGISEGASKSNLYKARIKLQKMISLNQQLEDTQYA